MLLYTESATVPQPPASEQVQPRLVEGAVSVDHTSRELHSSGRNDSVSSTGIHQQCSFTHGCIYKTHYVKKMVFAGLL